MGLKFQGNDFTQSELLLVPHLYPDLLAHDPHGAKTATSLTFQLVCLLTALSVGRMGSMWSLGYSHPCNHPA